MPGRRRRDTDEPALVVVTKFFPASDVDLLAELGVTDVGENRDQEAAAKCAELRRTATGSRALHRPAAEQQGRLGRPLRRRRAVGRPGQARARRWTAAPRQLGRRLEVTVQVSLDDGAGPRRAWPPARRARARRPGGRGRGRCACAGVMAVAPLGGDPRAAFARLRRGRRRHPGRPPRRHWLSAGMSGDLEAAVAEGATHLRVGSAILGSRPSHR